MKKLSKWMLLAVTMLASLTMVSPSASAQPGGGVPMGGMGGMAGMDFQEIQKQIQQRMMESFREQLSVTNDAEWQVIETRLAKVTRLQMETMMSGMGMGMMRRGGGGGGPGGPGGGFPGFNQPNPELEALQKAIDSNVPAEQMKRALAQYREARKRKQNELVKAQDDLRAVLSSRQEAVMVSVGMLN